MAKVPSPALLCMMRIVIMISEYMKYKNAAVSAHMQIAWPELPVQCCCSQHGSSALM